MSVYHGGHGSDAVNQFGRQDTADATDDIADEQVDSYLIETAVVLLLVVERKITLHDEGSSKGVRRKEETQQQDVLQIFLFDA